MVSLRSLALLALSASLAAAADSRPKPENPRTYRLQWRDLDRLTRGKTIDLKLPSGIELKGEVLEVAPQELRLKVSDTSDRRLYPKGPAAVPRGEVKRLRILESGKTGKIVGGIVGGVIGTLAAVVVVETCEGSGPVGRNVFLSITVPTALGFFAGMGVDRKVTEVIVEPETPPVRTTSAMPLPSWLGLPVLEDSREVHTYPHEPMPLFMK
jgi:hypothetical protein